MSLCGPRPDDQVVHRIGGRAALDVDRVIAVEQPGGHAELARAAGHVGCVIEQTMPGLVLRASTVVLKAICRAAFHSAGVMPPSSSRKRTVMIRAACDFDAVPDRFTVDFRNSGPAPPPMSAAWSLS